MKKRKKPDSKPVNRARESRRRAAILLNPSPFAVVYDSRGRPRHEPRHTFAKAD